MEENNQDIQEMIKESARHFAKETIENIPMDIPEAEKEKYTDVMMKILMEKQSPMQAMGFSDEMIEHMYAYGHRLYNNGNYKKAKNVFTSLNMLKPDDARFYLGTGACCQRLKDWENAAAAYNSCSLLDTKSPMPLFYLSECLNQLKLYEEAAECLNEVVARCGDEPLFANIKERSQLLLQSEKKQEEPVVEKSP